MIAGYNDLLLHELDDDPPRQRNALKVRKACERAGELTGQLLAMGRGQRRVPPAALHARCSVLLVVGDPQLAGFTRQVLADAGCSVHEAGHAGEARMIAEDTSVPIHLLVADLAPGASGGRARLRAIADARPGLRTLLLVARGAAAGSLDEAREEDSELLLVPFQPEELLARVRAMVPDARVEVRVVE